MLLATYFITKKGSLTMLGSKVKGACRLVTKVLFYNDEGKLSLIKCVAVAGAIYYFAFINPIMLAAIAELFVIFFALYMMWRIIAAAFSGDLESYAKTPEQETEIKFP